ATATAVPDTNNKSFRVSVTSALVLGTLNGFTIGVAGQSLGLWLDGSHDPTLVENLGANSYLGYSGLGSATVDESTRTISGSFNGWVEYCVMSLPMARGYNCGTSNITGEPIPGVAVLR